MARDNHPRTRQLSKIIRKDSQYEPYERVLIVCEGSKTEPNYFDEIRSFYNIPSAVVVILPSGFGTCPKKIVDYAYKLFMDGDYHLNIKPKSYDRIYAVFDRDQHHYYNDALVLANKYQAELKSKKIDVVFQAIASVPCFEIWLLLHFEYIQHAVCRGDVYKKLKALIKDYSKGKSGYYKILRNELEKAKINAAKLKQQNEAKNGEDPFTDVDLLVDLLENMRKK